MIVQNLAIPGCSGPSDGRCRARRSNPIVPRCAAGRPAPRHAREARGGPPTGAWSIRRAGSVHRGKVNAHGRPGSQPDETGDGLERVHHERRQQRDAGGPGGRQPEQDPLLREIHLAKARAAARGERLVRAEVRSQLRHERFGGQLGGPRADDIENPPRESIPGFGAPPRLPRDPVACGDHEHRDAAGALEGLGEIPGDRAATDVDGMVRPGGEPMDCIGSARIEEGPGFAREFRDRPGEVRGRGRPGRVAEAAENVGRPQGDLQLRQRHGRDFIKPPAAPGLRPARRNPRPAGAARGP